MKFAISLNKKSKYDIDYLKIKNNYNKMSNY